MIIVLIGISILIGAFFLWQEEEELLFIPGIGFLIKFATLVYFLSNLIGLKVIDEKIELYQKQNEEIENKVELVVKQYIQHEKETFVELKGDTSYMTLVTLYPELKSDKLIEQEINLYEENNKYILELKEQKINEKIYKWWLYFGK